MIYLLIAYQVDVLIGTIEVANIVELIFNCVQ